MSIYSTFVDSILLSNISCSSLIDDVYHNTYLPLSLVIFLVGNNMSDNIVTPMFLGLLFAWSFF